MRENREYGRTESTGEQRVLENRECGRTESAGLRGHIQTILGKINVIMTLGGRGSRIMTLIRSALFELADRAMSRQLMSKKKM